MAKETEIRAAHWLVKGLCLLLKVVSDRSVDWRLHVKPDQTMGPCTAVSVTFPYL